MAPLMVCMKAGVTVEGGAAVATTFPKTAKEALRALGAAAQHKAFGMVLLKTQGPVRYALTSITHVIVNLYLSYGVIGNVRVHPSPIIIADTGVYLSHRLSAHAKVCSL